jgi:amino acid transporter
LLSGDALEKGLALVLGLSLVATTLVVFGRHFIRQWRTEGRRKVRTMRMGIALIILILFTWWMVQDIVATGPDDVIWFGLANGWFWLVLTLWWRRKEQPGGAC